VKTAAGQFRDEDPPGNHLLREANPHLQLLLSSRDASEEIADTTDFPPRS